MSELTPETVQYLVVHASATPPDMDIGAAEIRRWHREKGWLDIGYTGVIRRDGTYENGRPLPQVGAHVKGMNWCSIGICLVGGVDKKGKPENNFTPEQFETLRWTLDSLLETFHKAKVVGHRDFEGVHKDCPCFSATDWYYNSPES